MKIYTAHLKPNDPNPLEDIILVEEGFSWFAAIFHVFWALYNKMWKVAAIVFAIEMIFVILEVQGIITTSVADAARMGFLLMVGFWFNDWYRASLEEKGYILQAIVSGKNEDEARYKVMSGMLQRSTFVAGNNSEGLIY